MDIDVKNVLVDIHERAFQRRSTMQATRASKFDAPTSSNANQKEKDEIHGYALTIIVW